MDDRDTTFRFPLTRTLPLLGSFLVLLLIVASGFLVGGYNPALTVILWLGLIGSGWFALSDLVTRAIVREDGLQVRWLSSRGVRTRLILWDDVQDLRLSGNMPDVLQLGAGKDVSTNKWTLPAHLALVRAVVRQARLQPHPGDRTPGVDQAFEALQETKKRSERYLLQWQWRRVERELENE
jgi:hypothetical protein